MRQVFRMRPWIFPPEPQAIQEIFVRYGVIREFAKGAVMEHGGKGDAAQVGFLTKGLATFSCLDVQSQTHIFALLAPGRASSMHLTRTASPSKSISSDLPAS